MAEHPFHQIVGGPLCQDPELDPDFCGLFFYWFLKMILLSCLIFYLGQESPSVHEIVSWTVIKISRQQADPRVILRVCLVSQRS